MSLVEDKSLDKSVPLVEDKPFFPQKFAPERELLSLPPEPRYIPHGDGAMNINDGTKFYLKPEQLDRRLLRKKEIYNNEGY